MQRWPQVGDPVIVFSDEALTVGRHAVVEEMLRIVSDPQSLRCRVRFALNSSLQRSIRSP